MFQKIDLKQELKETKRCFRKANLLKEVNDILEEDRKKEYRIISNLNAGSTNEPELYEVLDEDDIYGVEEIRAICIKYRLRFLDSSKFVGEIPYEAVSKIKVLEKRLNQPLGKFKIIAPKKLFKLEDKDSDPLLFAELPGNNFYFIHKWGNEINPLRATMVFPLRSLKHMSLSLLALALIVSVLIPTSSPEVFAFLFVHSFIAICGLACLIVFTARENFSDLEWDSKYLN